MRSVGDVVAQVRIDINDTDSTGYRYADPDLISNVQDGVSYLWMNRPDLFVGKWTEPVLSALDDPLPVPDFLFRGLVHFAVGLAEIRDDEYAVSGRVTTVAQLAERYLK